MERVAIDPLKWMTYAALAQETHERMANEGILLASLDQTGKLNPMTIGWGVFGWIWGRPIFTVLVRPSRYTFDCIEATGDFTVNVQPAELKNAADFCGTESGRDRDKVKEMELTPLPSPRIKGPGLAEALIVFECRIVTRNDILPPEVIDDINTQYYPDGDYHRVYYGQILGITVQREFFDRISA